jgi:hypothetical protein
VRVADLGIKIHGLGHDSKVKQYVYKALKVCAPNGLDGYLSPKQIEEQVRVLYHENSLDAPASLSAVLGQSLRRLVNEKRVALHAIGVKSSLYKAL